MSVAEAKRWTYEDYARIPDDRMRHEVIGGDHYVTPAPSIRHQKLLGRLYLALHAALEADGQIYFAPVDVLLSKHDIVQPDLTYLSGDRADRVNPKNVEGAPDLVGEILSKSTGKRDRTLKLELYERAGVLEYWMIDSKRSTVTVYSRADETEAFGAPNELTIGHELTSDRLPLLRLALSELFAD